jgi:hypothetical protein
MQQSDGVFSPSWGSSSMTIWPGSATRMRKPISRAIGGGGRIPSRIARIASSPDIATAAWAAGTGDCQFTTRSRRNAGENRLALSRTVMGCSLLNDLHHTTEAATAPQPDAWPQRRIALSRTT